ncbi:hypothetical protein JGU66_15755 [Myxococcaceae bacterium JPH2]|nr:hypothetical protein [Myxococcaceae bacterium JPH2]
MFANAPARRPSHTPLATVLLALGFSFTAGCAGALDDPERFTGESTGCPSGTTAQSIIQSQCLSCHSTASKLGDLDLEAAGLPGRLFTTTTTSCGQQRPLADSSNPAGSYFLQKLGAEPSCGVRMPQGGQALSSAQVACLSAWLTAGKAGAP